MLVAAVVLVRLEVVARLLRRGSCVAPVMLVAAVVLVRLEVGVAVRAFVDRLDVLVAAVVLVRLDVVVQLVAGVGMTVVAALLLRHFRSSLKLVTAFADDIHKTYERAQIFPDFP